MWEYIAFFCSIDIYIYIYVEMLKGHWISKTLEESVENKIGFLVFLLFFNSRFWERRQKAFRRDLNRCDDKPDFVLRIVQFFVCFLFWFWFFWLGEMVLLKVLHTMSVCVYIYVSNACYTLHVFECLHSLNYLTVKMTSVKSERKPRDHRCIKVRKYI